MFGAIGGAISSIVSQVTSGQEINWKAVGISAASGAISGAITAACPCMGPVAAGVVQGTLSAATYAVTEKVAYGRDPSLGETLKVGLISGVTAGVTQYVGQELGLIQCFIAGTIVAAKEGPKKIEDIQPGDLVWATDPDTGETELKEVKQLFRNETDEWIHITVNEEEIVCTPNHPFWVPVKGWTKACHLRAGDRLQLLNGEYVVVEQIQHELLERPETTYNFEVEGLHTYFVGESGVLVHNKCSDMQRGLARQHEAKMTNTTAIKCSNGNKRIPDYLDTDNGVLGEAKSVKYLTKSSQLTDMFSYGHDNGYKMFLKVEKWTTISKPLKSFLSEMGVSINVF